MVAPTGTPTTGGRTGSGTFTVALPTGAVGFIAAVERKAGSVTPPTGWTLLASVVRDSTWSVNEIYTAGSSAGTSWSFTGTGTPAGIAVVILGLDGAPTIEQTANASGFTCPTTPATAGAALIVRAAFNQPAVGTAPTWTYPAAATLGRQSAFQTLSSEGWAVAIAASQQASAGAPGTAAYSASPTFGNGAWTLAVTSASSSTTYQVSGTVAATSATTGAASRLARTFTVSGTIAATSATTGDASRVASTFTVSGTVAATSATTADATRVPLVQQASGTTAVASSTTADATRVPAVLSVTGTITAATTSAGAVSGVVGVAGATAATTDTTGAVTATLAASGTTPATSGTSGAASVLGGPQTYPVTGTVTVTTGTTSAVTARLGVSGTSGTASGTSGDATVLRAPATYNVTGTITATTSTSGAVTIVGVIEAEPVPNPGLQLTIPQARLAIAADSTLTLTGHATLTLAAPHPRLEVT